MLSISGAYPRAAINRSRPLAHFMGNKDKDYSHLRQPAGRADLYGSEEYCHSREAADPHLAEILQRFLKKDDTILEIGCNTGNNLLSLGKRYQAYGVDLDRVFIRQLNESAVRQSLASRVHAAQWDMAEDGSQPPEWPDLKGKCGAIYAVHVLSHFSDKGLGDLVTQLKPYLKPGGVLVATILDPKVPSEEEQQLKEWCSGSLNRYREDRLMLGGSHAHRPEVVDKAFQGFELISQYSRRFNPGELTAWNLPEDRIRWVVYRLPFPEAPDNQKKFSFSALMSGMRSRLGCWGSPSGA